MTTRNTTSAVATYENILEQAEKQQLYSFVFTPNLLFLQQKP